MSDFYPIDLEPETPGPAQFATINDVQLRLGRDLTEAEEASVDLLLTLVTGVIYNAVDKTEEWASALDPVPTVIRGFCVELTCRALANPSGLFSKSETIGSYSYTNSFNRELPSGIALTDAETLVLRRSVWGTNAGSARAENVLDDLACELDEHEGS